MKLENSGSRSWGGNALALRAERRRSPHGWLTTPRLLLDRARSLDPRAISSLYAIYRRAIVHFLRRRGTPDHVAEDVTQGFFTDVLDRGDLATLRPDSSFRAWLRAGAEHQLFNERKRANARKRRLEPAQAAELRSEWEERQVPASDHLLDQRRTALLIDRAWARLRTAYQSLGRELLFDHLKRTLSRDERVDGEATDAVLCQQLGISANYLAVRRHHLKAEEFPAALLAELNARRAQEQKTGQQRTRAVMTVREELRALLDDL